MSNNPNHMDNLKPFKKGEDERRAGNGAKKKLPELNTLLADVLGGLDDNDSEARAILKSLLTQAKKGNVRAAEILLDRAYGKALQQVDTNLTVKEFSLKDLVKFKDNDGDI